MLQRPPYSSAERETLCEMAGDMENLFRKCLEEAEKGKQLVESYYGLHADGGKRRVVVLIFPDDDPRVLASVSRYLDTFLVEYGIDEAVLLSSINVADRDWQSLTSKSLHFHDLNQPDMDAVLRFYSFAQTECRHVKIMSFRMPFNQKADDLIGFKDITTDNLAYHCLFGMFGKDRHHG